MEKFILITGNPVQGFQYLGPFDTHTDAENAGDHLTGGDWWVATLNPDIAH
jgi:hypothetical protein